MTRLPILHLSACVTPNTVPHLYQWLWRFRVETLYCVHKKSQNSVADNTVPESVVPRTLIQAPVILACRIRRMLVPLRSWNKLLSLVSFTTSRSFCPSRLSSRSIRRCSELENTPPPSMSLISSAFPHWELGYFCFSDVTEFRRPSPSTLIGILLKVPTMGKRVFVFPKKIKGKKVSWNTSPMYQVTSCRNIHSD